MVYPESESWVEKLMTRGVPIGNGAHFCMAWGIDQVLEYMKWAKPIIQRLLEVLLERLNVKQIDEPMKSVVKDVLIVNLIHYPVCPSPELAVGAGHHADVSLITMLLQDDIVGLYVREPKGEGWIHVPPVKGALVINIGDVL
ncbi:Feruloyl CoA ortho-hydroxylase 1 [Capsicum annuum]|nr:Feruloyl CoA ortho-hydroxylase 1 [Capsicum annuum]KAF3632565.1 Feruloyl CoA ortho-hydroxylase 1 [Capsicum annuum]